MGDHVVARDAFFGGADPRNGGARTLVQRIRLQFDTHAAELFEGVPQHEVFGFGVDGGALPRRRDPGGADLDAAVVVIDAGEARAADRLAAGELDGRKRQRGSAGLLLQGELDVEVHVLRGTNDPPRIPAPDLRIETDGTELCVVIERQRLQSDVPPAKGDRFDAHRVSR